MLTDKEHKKQLASFMRYSVNKHPDYEVPELLTPVITKCQLLIDFSMR